MFHKIFVSEAKQNTCVVSLCHCHSIFGLGWIIRNLVRDHVGPTVESSSLIYEEDLT